ncbi:MAG: TolB family protein [Chloroflexota bacterium]
MKPLLQYSAVVLLVISNAGCSMKSTPKVVQQSTQISTAATISPTVVIVSSLEPTDTSTPIVKPSFRGIIAFASASRKYTSLALLDLKVGGIQSLPTMVLASSPSWSPDGQWLAFVGSSPDDQHSDIYKIRIDGSELIRLTNINPQGKGNVTWSPDGRFIAYSYQDKVSGIAVVNADENTTQVLTDVSGNAYSPTWSPKSNQIAYLYVEKLGAPIVLVVMDADGKNTKLLKEFPFAWGGNVDWSPDGKWLAIVYGKAPESTNVVCSDIYLIRPDGSDLTRLTELTTLSMCAEYVVWSPDGKYLAFVGRNITGGQTNIMNKGSQIYIMDLASKNIFPVTNEQDWSIDKIDWNYTVDLK